MTSTDASRRLEVGRIVRAHGVRGDVIVDPVTNRPERFTPGSILYAGARRFEIERARPHQGRWILALAGVTDRTTADGLRGTTLTGDPLGPLPDDEFWVHEVIGRSVIDQHGTVAGTIVALEANPASDLLVLDTGRLVPSVFVTAIRDDGVVVDAPPGLLTD